MDKEMLAVRVENSIQLLSQTQLLNKIAEMTQGENKVLMYLCSCEEGEVIYPSQISQYTLISRQRVTAVLSALEKKGFVTLENSKDDRRRVQVSLTPKGYHLIKKKRDEVNEYFDFLLDAMGGQALLQMTEIFDKAINSLIEAEKEGRLK